MATKYVIVSNSTKQMVKDTPPGTEWTSDQREAKTFEFMTEAIMHASKHGINNYTAIPVSLPDKGEEPVGT